MKITAKIVTDPIPLEDNICAYCEEETDLLIPTIIPLFSGLTWECCTDCHDFSISEKIRLAFDPTNSIDRS